MTQIMTILHSCLVWFAFMTCKFIYNQIIQLFTNSEETSYILYCCGKSTEHFQVYKILLICLCTMHEFTSTCFCHCYSFISSIRDNNNALLENPVLGL